jgi:hypothetical protein
LVREQCIDCYAACFRKRVVLFERVLLTEACRGKGSTLILSLKRFDMLVLCMPVDGNVFTLLVQFTYDFENICMNCYDLVTYA